MATSINWDVNFDMDPPGFISAPLWVMSPADTEA